jgi:hypothetical protein
VQNSVRNAIGKKYFIFRCYMKNGKREKANGKKPVPDGMTNRLISCLP